MNIRYKLTIQFSLIVVSILLVFTTSIYFFSASYRENDYYNRLKDRANTTARLLLDVQEVDKSLLKIIDKNTQALNQEVIYIIDEDDNTIYCSTGDSIYSNNYLFAEIRFQHEVKTKENQKDVLGILYTYNQKEYIVIASAYDIYGWAKVKNLKLILIIGFIISIFITVFAGLLFAGRALAPISNVIGQVKKITISNLNSRVDEGNRKDEIAQLSITFNQMLQRLEEAFILQRDFVSNAAHELRTPFTVMLTEVDYILMQERDKTRYISTLTNLSSEIRKLSKLSNGLLDLARISYDNSNFELKTFRLDELLLEICNDIITSKKEYKTNIAFENLPEDDQYLSVLGSEHLLSIAIKNIIENACKFSNFNAVDITFIVLEKSISVQFSDKGIGISKEDINNIFQPFFRGKNTQFISGYGLGLALTQKIIQLHNGRITVTSELGVGSVFTINLPNRLNF